MHRKDLNGNDIREEPIFNSIETGTNFKYRYQYLTDTFPNPDTVPLDSVNPFSCADVDPQKLIFFSYSFKNQKQEKTKYSSFNVNNSRNFQILDI